VYSFHSYFFELQDDFDYSQRAKSFENLGTDFTTFSRVIVPIHLKKHWMLIVADMPSSKFYVFDSCLRMDIDHTEIVGYLQPFFCSLAPGLIQKPKEECRPWEVEIVTTCPQQRNDFDSGIYLLKNMERLFFEPKAYSFYYSLDSPISYLQR
jgi:Ulp1 family protease